MSLPYAPDCPPIPSGHYVETKDGPVWVGSAVGELELLRTRIRRALGILTSPSFEYDSLREEVDEAVATLEGK